MLVTSNQQHCQSNDTHDDGEGVRTHQFEAMVRPSTERDNLEFLFVGETENEREPRDPEEATVSGGFGVIVRVPTDERKESFQPSDHSSVVVV